MLSSDRWERTVGLFATAAELEDHARAAFLDSACGDDRDLRAEVWRSVRGNTASA